MTYKSLITPSQKRFQTISTLPTFLANENRVFLREYLILRVFHGERKGYKA